MKTITSTTFLLLILSAIGCQKGTDTKPSPPLPPPEPELEYKLVWQDEFNIDGKPNAANWIYENGFVRNEELQWYRPDNATCKDGVLIIEGRKEKTKNNNYESGSTDWTRNREYAEYTSASIQTNGLQQWQFGLFEIRAKIDTTKGAWPAIWTLGAKGEWPSGGEVDIMEFYRVNHQPTILANTAWGTDKRFVAKWDTKYIPLEQFTSKDIDWVNKFHVWKMEWTKDFIKLFLDDELLNQTSLKETINADGTNPFLQPHFILLNLAIGGLGETPDENTNLIRYEVDYVRVYQRVK